MSKKSIVIITLLFITTVVSSGFAVFNYDRYKTVVRKGENLDSKIEELIIQRKAEEEKNKKSQENILTLQETISLLENKVNEFEQNEQILKQNAASWEEKHKILESKYNNLVEKIQGINNLTK